MAPKMTNFLEFRGSCYIISYLISKIQCKILYFLLIAQYFKNTFFQELH